MNTLLSHEQLNQQDLALSNQGHSVLRPSFGLIVVGFFIAGMLYATASVSIAQLIFPKQANGSVIELNGKIIGSSLKSKLIVAFTTFSIVPTLLVLILSVFYLNSSFETWFSQRMVGILKNASEVIDSFIIQEKRKGYEYAKIGRAHV